MKHIALIGIDGSGKSTLAENLMRYLTMKQNYKVTIAKSDRMNSKVLKEIESKGEYPVVDDLRLTAYALDLSIKYRELANGKEMDFIIWDRYYYCLFAYFSALHTDVDCARKITSIMPVPDYTFMLEVDVAVAIERIRQRGGPQKSDENSKYLMSVQKAYWELLKDCNTIRINADQSQEEILHDALKYIL